MRRHRVARQGGALLAGCGLDHLLEFRRGGPGLRGGEQLVEAFLDALGEIGRVRHHLAAGRDRDGDLPAIGEDRHDEAHAVEDGAEAELGDQPCAGHVERHIGAGHIGDDAVHRQLHPVGEAETRIEPRRQPRRHRRNELGVVGHVLGADRVGKLLGTCRVREDGLQPLHRVGDIGADGDRHGGDLVAGGFLRRCRADGDWRHRHHGIRRQLFLVLEIFAQGAAADRQHHVVDGGAGYGGADEFEIIEREAAAVEHPVRRHAGIEAGARHGAGRFELAGGHLEAGAGQRGDRAGQHIGKAERLHGGVAGGARQQLKSEGLTLRHPLLLRRLRLGVRCQVVDGGGHFRAGDPVNGRVVHLGDDGEGALGNALHIVEAFQHVEFPQRPVGIQRAGMQARDLNAQLPPVTGMRQGDVAHMELDVEIRILEPVGVVQIARHIGQPLAEGACQMQAAFVVPQDFLERQHPAGNRRLVVDGDRADMHWRVLGLEIQKCGVQRAELFHATPSPRLLLR